MSKTLDEMKQNSIRMLKTLREDLQNTYDMDESFHRNVCVYACGSMGRLELTNNSDLDLFFITMNKESGMPWECANLDKYIFFAKLFKINEKNNFQEPSKKGAYWEFIAEDNLLDIGSRQEDYNNSFTARMLLILESKPLYNDEAYEQLIVEIVHKYFGDFEKHKDDFRPLFLMNDILRYWYTLTLNYEYRRDSEDDDNKKYWKRLKLKFARLITCFSMLACLYKEGITEQDVINFIKKTPFERLEMLAEEHLEVKPIVEKIVQTYGWFLELRKESPTWWNAEENRRLAIEYADKFHKLVVHDLMNEVAKSNLALRDKMDVY